MTSTIRLPSAPGRQAGLRDHGAGDPVLLIHGVGLQSAAWTPQIEALSRSRRVIAPDLPGHGRNPAEVSGALDLVDWLTEDLARQPDGAAVDGARARDPVAALQDAEEERRDRRHPRPVADGGRGVLQRAEGLLQGRDRRVAGAAVREAAVAAVARPSARCRNATHRGVAESPHHVDVCTKRRQNHRFVEVPVVDSLLG